MRVIILMALILGSLARAEDATLDKQVAELALGLGAEKEADRQAPQVELEKLEMSATAPGHDAERTAYSLALVAALKKSPNVPAKIWLLRSLDRSGRQESLNAEFNLCTDPDEHVRDAAIRAIANNSSETAAALLHQMIQATKNPQERAALILALGYKKNPDAERLFAQETQNADAGVREAARHALGRIGHRADSGALNDAAMLIDMGRAGNVADIPKLIAGLDATNLKVRQAAVQAVNLNPSNEMTTALIAKVANAGPDVKPALLLALADRGDERAQSALLAGLRSDSPEVRRAALKGLGKIGDGWCVGAMLEFVGKGSDEELRVMRESLDLMNRPEVDEALAGGLNDPDPLQRREAALHLGTRGFRIGDTFVKLLSDPDESVRIEALKALAAVGSKYELPPLLALLANAHSFKADAVEHAARAALAISRRNPDVESRAAVLITALNSPDAEQAPFLNLLAQLGGKNALEAVRAKLRSADKAAADGAVRALSNWSDAAPLADLLRLAQSSDNETHRVLALRGYFRIAALPGELPAGKRLEMIDEGLKAAKSPNDKKLALAALSEIDDIAAFKRCAQLMNDAEVREEACAALAKSARFFLKSHGNEVAALMESVLEKAQSPATKKLAAEMKSKAAKK